MEIGLLNNALAKENRASAASFLAKLGGIYEKCKKIPYH